MTAEQATDMQQAIVRDLIEQAPDGWQRLRMDASELDGVMVFDAVAYVPGRSEPVRYFPDQATFVTSDLPQAMYQPGKGAWLSVECTVEPSRTYHFKFNYDQPVTFDGREPDEQTWINDLRRYPRDWDMIPDWHVVKQKYSEEEWLASVQRYQDWLASDDPRPFTG